MWLFVKKPKDQVYKDLVDLALTVCTKFILVMRTQSTLEKNDNCYHVLKELNNFLVDSKNQDEWPGTKLLGHTATVNYYRFNEKSRELLKKHAQSLFSWVHPNLPEDICFLKDDGKPWLVTIAHESEGYIVNETIQEIERLKLIDGIEIKKIDVAVNRD